MKYVRGFQVLSNPYITQNEGFVARSSATDCKNARKLLLQWLLTTADSQLRMRDIEGSCDNLLPLHLLPLRPKKQSRQEIIEENS